MNPLISRIVETIMRQPIERATSAVDRSSSHRICVQLNETPQIPRDARITNSSTACLKAGDGGPSTGKNIGFPGLGCIEIVIEIVDCVEQGERALFDVSRNRVQ